MEEGTPYARSTAIFRPIISCLPSIGKTFAALLHCGDASGYWTGRGVAESAVVLDNSVKGA